MNTQLKTSYTFRARVLGFFLATLSFSLSSWGDGPVNPDVLNQILANTSYLANSLKPTLNFQIQQDYKPGPDDGNLIAGNSAKISNLSELENAINTQVGLSVNNFLNNASAPNNTQSTSTTNPPHDNQPSSILKGMAEVPGPDYPAPTVPASSSNSIAGANIPEAQLVTLNQPFSMEALLNKTYYNLGSNTTGAINMSNPPINPSNASLPASNDAAMNFIYYLTDLANPPTSINYQMLAAPNPLYDAGSTDPNFNTTCGGRGADYAIQHCIQNNPEVESYRLTYRSWVALESVALSNLLHSYYERMPIQNLGKQAGLTTSNDPIYPDASVLQVDEYMAKRRLTPAWSQQVSSEPPATVQREMLMVLSEMRYEEYQQRLATERLNVTLNAILVSSARSTKQALDNSKDAMQCAVNPKLCATQSITPISSGNGS